MEKREKIELVQRVDFIKAACKGRSVLHLGCTNWPYTADSIEKGSLLHFELREIAEELYGFDFDEEGVRTLREAGVDDLFRADLEDLDSVPLDKQFDVVIAGEMIEHLSNPGLFLSGIKRFLKPGGDLVITTINAYSIFRFVIYGLRGKGGYNEPVHPDHVAYYSYKTLNLLTSRHGFETTRFCFYDIGIEHRPYNRFIFNLINDIGVRFSKQLADGVISVCRVSD